MRLSQRSYNLGDKAGDNYNFSEYDRQYERGQNLRDAARRFARLGGVQTDERGHITGGDWNRKSRGLISG